MDQRQLQPGALQDLSLDILGSPLGVNVIGFGVDNGKFPQGIAVEEGMGLRLGLGRLCYGGLSLRESLRLGCAAGNKACYQAEGENQA